MKLRIANEARDNKDRYPWTPYKYETTYLPSPWFPITWPALRADGAKSYWTDDVMVQLREMVK